MTHHVLLAGCGDVGTALGQRLVERGWHATGVRRRPDQLPAEISPVALDLTNPGTAALPPTDAVVITLTADGRDVAAYERTYLGALRGLHRALSSDGSAPQRMVLVSSTGVLGGGDGEIVTEATPPSPARDTARVLLAAEELAAELFPGVIIVRPAGIYGPGRASLIDRVRRGEALTHNRMTNRIHRDDLVTVLQTVLESPEPPALVHAVDTEPAVLGDVATHIAGLLGVPVPADSSSSADNAPRGKVLDSSLMQEFVGALRYPTYREGYAALLSTEESS
ncbi:SDR family oxidoreductase [Kocuria gwangalliensis]|uniref:SDR family oxidoreductase n=1 Tax=Kocuria gwangalliensis TaxID=501592 RepID=A0ABP8X4D0_9MICC